MYHFVRIIDIPEKKKHIHRGPCADGSFWSLSTCHDLPLTLHNNIEVTAEEMFAACDVYMEDAKSNGKGWKKIGDDYDLNRFHSEVVEFWDDPYHNYVRGIPFMPEFYCVPKKTWNGMKFRKKIGQDVESDEFVQCPHCGEESCFVRIDVNGNYICDECGDEFNIED